MNLIEKCKTYEQSKSKRYIQQKIWDYISGLGCSVLCLAGPTPKTYLKNLIKYVASKSTNKIRSWENKGNIYHEQLQILQENTLYQKKVEFNFGDISQGNVERFIDLDFCCILESAKTTIGNLFLWQNKVFTNTKERKAFCFTVSYMYVGYENIVPFLEKLLKLRIDIDYLAKTDLHTEVMLKYDMKKYRINLYTYCDSSPMATVLIQYF